MARYRSIPIEVEAWPVSTLCKNFWAGKELPNALQKKLEAGTINFSTNGIYIEGPSGVFFATSEEILIKRSDYEFDASKASDFYRTYKQIFDF